MRTPGDDFELAAGFLFTEGVLASAEDVEEIRHCGRSAAGRENVVRVTLRSRVAVDLPRLERNCYTTSSCGVCGKTSIAAVQIAQRHRLSSGPVLDAEVIHTLPAALRARQGAFQQTGGLHAAALFDEHGTLLSIREDVGRHNALDKLIGERFLAGDVPLAGCVLLVSGRASFELVQKATMAGIPVLAAVGAPSSLAVDLARDRGMTLLGFVRDRRFNIYAGPERIDGLSESASRGEGLSDAQPPPVFVARPAAAPSAAV
jgi:FdhD protein